MMASRYFLPCYRPTKTNMLDFGKLSRPVETSRIVSGRLRPESNVERKRQAEKAFLNTKEAKVAKAFDVSSAERFRLLRMGLG
jgi:hypothetical protein